MEKEYRKFASGSACLDLKKDTFTPKKNRHIAKEMTLAYMRLLTNYNN
jgi:hypothetical protein